MKQGPRTRAHPAPDVLGLGDADLAALAETVPRLHAWYRSSARDLPWRRTRDPYAVWVSEAMLQQTRVSTVIPYFERWMKAFPTIAALAGANEGHVLKLWEGLGYYSRARNLQRGALDVVERFGGTVPRDPDAFRSLPGVGAYTAAAVLSIAFDLDLAVVDGNAVRVLTRLTACGSDPRRAPVRRAIEGLAERLLPPGTAAVHNQAVMELGAVVCAPRSPRCEVCPLRPSCRARLVDPEAFPARREPRAVPHRDVAIGLVLKAGSVLVSRRPYGGMLGGLWEFPGGKVEPGETPREALHRELWEEVGLRVRVERALPTVDHAYSHLRVTLHPFVCSPLESDPRVGEGHPTHWIRVDELPDYPMPRANRKVIEGMEWENR